MKIVTNHKPRDVLFWYELTEKQRADFDYINTEVKQDDARFIVYRASVYDLGEFSRITPRSIPSDPHPCSMKVDDGDPLLKWDGYLSETYFSMVIVKYLPDFEQVVVGLAFS